MADQQFCLRWNNHQSTLISVFDSLLERGAMVDCTLAAEGQSLQAHKVVLSACSPYLESLLSQHYDKHPILLLKDVKFYELQAMMDYMYRGEVNVAQDKLGMFLKAAESLQIKGLSDSGGGEPVDSGGGTAPKRTSKSVPVSNAPRAPVERRRPPQVVDIPSDQSQDGSLSPSLRKRRRRMSNSEESTPATSTKEVEASSNSSAEVSRTQGSSASATSVPNTEIMPSVPINGSTDNNALGIFSSLIEGNAETDNLANSGPLGSSSGSQPNERLREKIEPTSEVMIEPKTEYLEAEDDVEDLTLDDNMESDMSSAGPSRQSGYQWQDQSTDEVFMAAQEAVGANRDAQDIPPGPLASIFGSLSAGNANLSIKGLQILPSQAVYTCAACHSEYATKQDLETHELWCDKKSFGYDNDQMEIYPLPPGSPASGSSQQGGRWSSGSRETKKRHTYDRIPGNHPCNDCGKMFSYKRGLDRHRKLECKMEPRFSCPHCNHRAKRSEHLYRHMVSQHGMKPSGASVSGAQQNVN